MKEVMIRASILVLAFAVAMPVFAQQRTGTVDGVVLDEGGVALPGVTVILTGNNIMGEPATVTDAAGQFRFPLVPPGAYTAKAVLPGYQTVQHSEIPVNVGQSSHLTITDRKSVV